MFRIGDFARFSRVSVTMLRHYHEVGLMTPAHVDPGGHGYYRADQLPRLNRILLLRDLGLERDEIAGLLSRDDPEEFDRVFAERERDLAETLARTQARLRAVRSRRALLDDEEPAGDVVIRPVPSLLVATLTGHASDDVGALIYELESRVRDLRARSGRPPLALLPEPDDDRITVAVPLNWPIPADDRISVGFLDPVPRMACVIHHGGHAGLSALLQRMLLWLDLTGERPAGPIREVYLRFGAEPELGLPASYLTDQRANLVTEVQVPLRARDGAGPSGTA